MDTRKIIAAIIVLGLLLAGCSLLPGGGTPTTEQGAMPTAEQGEMPTATVLDLPTAAPSTPTEEQDTETPEAALGARGTALRSSTPARPTATMIR